MRSYRLALPRPARGLRDRARRLASLALSEVRCVLKSALMTEEGWLHALTPLIVGSAGCVHHCIGRFFGRLRQTDVALAREQCRPRDGREISVSRADLHP